MLITKLITNTTQYMYNITYYKKFKTPVLLIGITDKLTIYYTNKNDANFDSLNNIEYTVINYPSNGGTAISQTGDLGFYFGIRGKHQGWCLYIYNNIKLWLKELGITAKIINNDFTIHGRKVMGYTETIDPSYSHSAIFVAMSNSKDLIKTICLKPKNKEFGGFNEYGITISDIIERVEQATYNYITLIKKVEVD